MVLFLVIILLLSVSSAYYLNRLSGKTNAILKENHYSVVYAQDMSAAIIHLNQRITNWHLTGKNPDTLLVNKEFVLFAKSLELEKNNITEPGEDKLVKDIETDYTEYCNFISEYIKSPESPDIVLSLQNSFESLYGQLLLLSQLNEKAIEEKTTDAKVSAKKFTLQMTFIGSLCFLVAYAFSFMFSSYFNERFYRLYYGILDSVSDNYRQKVILEGNDELSGISSAFNNLIEKLNTNPQKKSLNVQDDHGNYNNSCEIEVLKDTLLQIRELEEHVMGLISRLEKK
jgi:nitrogen fixation/metabolism regulation signal transduction histidine kinase